MGAAGLIGRDAPRARLADAAARAADGLGSLVLVAGPAGIGKTALLDDVLAGSALTAVRATAPAGGSQAWGPVVAALRAARRRDPASIAVPAPLAPHLALLLPETGGGADASDRATVVEAVLAAFAALAATAPTAVVLDDLQWADHATCELLPVLAAASADQPLLVLAAYRSEALARGHPLRAARHALRRAGALREVELQPLDPDGTRALAGRVLGEPVADAVAVRLHARSGGVPFAVLELAAAIAGGADEDAPLPETLREAVLSGLSGVPAEARAALEQAAALGVRFDLRLLVGLAGEAAVLAALDAGPLEEDAPGEAAFRHALVREAVLADVPWPRRRGLHERAATALAASGAPAVAVAEQWLAARRTDQAGPALAAAARESLAMYAARDALALAQRALSAGTPDPALERELLELAGRGAEQCGELEAAHDAWRAVAERAPTAGARIEALQHLAGVLELRGEWQRALDTRLVAADALVDVGRPGDAARERLRVVSVRQSGGVLEPTLALVEQARAEAEQGGDAYAVARALGFEGQIRGKLGEHERGLALVRQALTLALEHEDHAAAAETYTKLAVVLAHRADYGGAADAYGEAYAVCAARGLEGEGHVCLACLGNVLRQSGDWDRTLEVCAEVPADASPDAVVTAEINIAAVRILRGETRQGRPLAEHFLALCRDADLPVGEIEGRWIVALADEADGRAEAADAQCRALLARLADTDDRHYVVPVLRWTATFMGERGAADAVRQCAAELSARAAGSHQQEALGALAHVLGELALLEGDATAAAERFEAGLAELDRLEVPWDRALTALRAGVAHAAAGDPERARTRLTEALDAARRLGARPLAARAAAELHASGGPSERRSAAARAAHGLTPRELEVLRRVAAGRTNRQIAEELVLSPRTIEMHAQNALAKLGARSRAEASARAAALGLLEPAEAP